MELSISAPETITYNNTDFTISNCNGKLDHEELIFICEVISSINTDHFVSFRFYYDTSNHTTSLFCSEENVGVQRTADPFNLGSDFPEFKAAKIDDKDTLKEFILFVCDQCLVAQNPLHPIAREMGKIPKSKTTPMPISNEIRCKGYGKETCDKMGKPTEEDGSYLCSDHWNKHWTLKHAAINGLYVLAELFLSRAQKIQKYADEEFKKGDNVKIKFDWQGNKLWPLTIRNFDSPFENKSKPGKIVTGEVVALFYNLAICFDKETLETTGIDTNHLVYIQYLNKFDHVTLADWRLGPEYANKFWFFFEERAVKKVESAKDKDTEFTCKDCPENFPHQEPKSGDKVSKDKPDSDPLCYDCWTKRQKWARKNRINYLTKLSGHK